MFRKIALTAVSAMAMTVGAAFAAGEEIIIPDVDFAHEGPFGKFDQMQLQRGLQVYTEVCAACHGLRYVPIRTLSDEGGPAMPETRSANMPSSSRSPTRKPARIAKAPRPTTSRAPRWKMHPTSA